MANLSSAQARDLCLRLLQAETDDEVIQLLGNHGYWTDRSVWKPYGDIPNNRSIVGNQQSSAVAALVEKLVNSIDAVLTAECYRNGIDPTSPAAPRTMREAVERFFPVKEGRIRNLSASERTRLAERIQLVACGTKENPAYLIVDAGEGQCPDQFSNTFLSLIRENKTRIPFVQGKFNMGGTGVLQFAGSHSFQLIISKRQPDIPPCSSDSQRNQWGFTLIRRLAPGPEQPQSMYVYLAPAGQILSFEAESLPLRPGRYPEAYSEELEAGTCIKLWNYKFPGRLKSLATLDLRYALECYLQDPVLPIRVCERRTGYRAHYYDTTVSGLANVLFDKHEDVELETGSPLKVPNVGDIDIRIVIVKEDLGEHKEDRYPAGVFFTVNGQLHSEFGKDFISRRTKFDYVADTMIVVVDCTHLPQQIREDLFMASRDRMRQCDERELLEAAITEYLKDHQGIRELNARRRQARLASALSEEETAKVIQNLVRADPTLAQLFGRGERVRVPGGPLPEPEPYEGRRFPTFFRIRNEPKEGLVKHCPRNRPCRIEFETDAANDYFVRAVDPGHLETRGALELISRHLWNGKAILRFSLPQNSNVGDRLGVDVSVSDVSRVEPLRSHFVVQVEPEELGVSQPPPPSPSGAKLTGLPNVQEVRRDEWARYGFDENSALLMRSGGEDGLDVFINMDNLNLRNEIARRRDVEPTILNYWFKWGLCLLALGMLYQQRRSLEKSGSIEEDDYAQINEASKGLSVTLIPVLAQLGRAEQRRT
jgi:hypothetical protein